MQPVDPTSSQEATMKPLRMIAVLAISFLPVGTSLPGGGGASAKDERMSADNSGHSAEWMETLTQLEGFEFLTADTGAFSRTTGEDITGKSLFLSATIEGNNGDYHAGFDQKPQQILIFRTTSGRFVVRFLEW